MCLFRYSRRDTTRLQNASPEQGECYTPLHERAFAYVCAKLELARFMNITPAGREPWETCPLHCSTC